MKIHQTLSPSGPPKSLHPLVPKIIVADIISLLLVVVAGAIWPQINMVGGYLLCMNGTLASSVPGEFVGINTITCTLNGASENITYAAMGLSFVLYSALFGGMAVLKYVLDEKSKKSPVG